MTKKFDYPTIRTNFRKRINEKECDLFLLKNNKETIATITNYGARWVNMFVQDKKNNFQDVVVGFNAIDGYLNSTEAYYGAVVGRFANRIAEGKFTLDGIEYKLSVNNPPNHLHGGVKGFHAVMWDVVSLSQNTLRLEYISQNGEEGYPGTVKITVEYHLTDTDEMQINFTGTTDAPTIISLAHHAFFNLNGQGNGSVLNHLLQINAGQFTPIDTTSIPTGEFRNVEGTAFDFRKESRIGSHINEPDEQLTNGSGYDHNFVLDNPGGMRMVARATGDLSNIKMEVFTTEPGMQLYSGNFMNGENAIKGFLKDEKYGAFCLETQHFPDSPNQPNFPTVVLRPKEKYSSTTNFQFT
ncbi:MAG: aldose epimerase family protein [Ferruginibacter sp.]